MEFAHDLMSALRGRSQSGPGRGATDDSGMLLDWSGLHARLSSAHALRRELSSSDSHRAVHDGGFSDWPLAVHGGAQTTRAVNLKDSTDRKGPQGMDSGTAGLVRAGSQEQ